MISISSNIQPYHPIFPPVAPPPISLHDHRLPLPPWRLVVPRPPWAILAFRWEGRIWWKNNGLIGLYKGMKYYLGDYILPSYIGDDTGSSSVFAETVGGDQDGPLWSAALGGWRCTRPRQQWSVENVAIEGLPLCVVPCLCSGLCGSGIGTTPRRSMLRRWSGVRTVVGITWCPWCTDGTWLAWGQGLTFPSLVSLLRGGRSAAQARSCSHWKGKEKGDDTTQLCGDYTNY